MTGDNRTTAWQQSMIVRPRPDKLCHVTAVDTAGDQGCGEGNPGATWASYPCILPAGHDPIAPGVRTHIDKDGDTW